MNEPKRKRGRPPKDGARRIQFKVMMTEEEFEKLSNASKIVGKSKSDIVREGIIANVNNSLYLHDLNSEEDEHNDFNDFYDDFDDEYDD